MHYLATRHTGCTLCGESTDTACRCTQLDVQRERSILPRTVYSCAGDESPPFESFEPGAQRHSTIRTDDSPVGWMVRSSGLVRSIARNSFASLLDDTCPDLNSPPRFQQKTIQLPTLPPNCYGPSTSQKQNSGGGLSSGALDCLESLFSLALPGDQLPQQTCSSPASIDLMPSISDLDSYSNDEFDGHDDPENILGRMINSLPLDRTVESNGVPFILQAHAKWMSHFLFEPMRVTDLSRDYIIEHYKIGYASRWKMDLLSNNAYAITRSTNYDLGDTPSFFTIQSVVLRKLTETASQIKTVRESDRLHALEAMRYTYELVTSLCKVGSLSCVLSVMQVVAPVFRRACPDPLTGLINLPALLSTINLQLQYYGALDVMLSTLTGRPMFFRYNVEFTPDAPESLFLLEDGPSLRWLYGVPDRLLLTLAKMNTLIEDFGPYAEQETVDELEREIKSVVPLVDPSSEPTLVLGRITVQECWCLAALIYLHMGLRGADSFSPQVASFRKQFLAILRQIKPRRNPDAFLVLPLVILGIATYDPTERSIIRKRMLGVSECSRPDTMGNDFVKILDSVWLIPRQVIWSDLRRACWEVSGL
ncbi:hypothetical protein RSOLAG1IB_09973 [Rhizoctonia solani AG-1 IB]|uniref:Fungal zn(2)-Cys(6) binuclear cluster domain-containing protein n=1 Tax=Thanatephorus cucumeris (strain AG1-IB / isolate 7/3/14) TaxID=1108050 RepID=A0A0B7FUH7_THACB|nr:hypothetical protein RSOLAG1IB_09973 [Rhizoctonia solani AG-1 IB]